MTRDKKGPKVVNIDTSTWSPEQVARELQQFVDAGEIQSVVVVVEFTPEVAKGGYVFDWIGSRQTFNERVYMVSWLYHRTMQRVFGV